jgi:hypothetical protein
MGVSSAWMADLPDPFLSFGKHVEAVAATRVVVPPDHERADWASHAITAIGLLFLVTALYALVGDGKLISLGYLDFNSSSATVTLEIVYICLGVGLLARRELLRELCVLAAVIGVAAALYGSYNYVRQANVDQPAAQLATERAQSHVTATQSEIAKLSALNDAGPSVQNDAQLAALNEALASAQTQAQTDAAGERWNYGGLVLAWVTALMPLVVLTRPKVIARFT